MRHTNRALFGGALLAAGMAAHSEAADFVFQPVNPNGPGVSFAYSQTAGAAVDSAYGPSVLNTFANSTTATFGTVTASTSQSSKMMRTEISWDGAGSRGYGYGRTFLQQFFQVSTDATLRIEWDLTGSNGYDAAFLLETAGGSTIFSFDGSLGDPLAGSAAIKLSAGVDYGVIFGDLSSGVGPFIFSTSTQFISATLVNDGVIPAPGAAGLFGLAALGMARRRRG